MKYDDIKKELEKFNSREAAEQTILSWIQMGLALIGLGFGLASIVAVMKMDHASYTMVLTVKIFGKILIAVGFFSMVLALWQHRKKIGYIKEEKSYYANSHSHNLSFYIGIIISLLGLLAFFIILIHMML